MSSSLPPNSPPKKNPLWGPFNAKPIIERALRNSHINGAKKLKLYSYIGIGKYLGVCPNNSARGRPGGAAPANVNLGPSYYLGNYKSRKLNLKTQLDVVKYSLWLQKFFR